MDKNLIMGAIGIGVMVLLSSKGVASEDKQSGSSEGTSIFDTPFADITPTGNTGYSQPSIIYNLAAPNFPTFDLSSASKKETSATPPPTQAYTPGYRSTYSKSLDTFRNNYSKPATPAQFADTQKMAMQAGYSLVPVNPTKFTPITPELIASGFRKPN